MNTRTVHPFELILEQETQRGWNPRHVHELSADVFATYTLGPAYAFTCIVGRFDPSNAYYTWPGSPSTPIHPRLGEREPGSRDARGDD